MARKKTSKNTTRATPIEKAPQLPQDDDEEKHEVTTAIVGHDGRIAGLTRAQDAVDALAGKGLSVVHSGGSLPLLNDKNAFRRPGDSIFGQFLGVAEPEQKKDSDDDFTFVTLAIHDPEDYDPKKPAASFLFKAQMSNSSAMKPWTSNPKNVGKFVLISYGGSQETKRGQTPFKCFTISEVA